MLDNVLCVFVKDKEHFAAAINFPQLDVNLIQEAIGYDRSS